MSGEPITEPRLRVRVVYRDGYAHVFAMEAGHEIEAGAQLEVGDEGEWLLFDDDRSLPVQVVERQWEPA